MTYYMLYRQDTSGRVQIWIPVGISGTPKIHMYDDRHIAERYAGYYKAKIKEINL